MTTTKTFRSGNSQAVRLPKDIAFEDGIELEVARSGDVVTLRPRRDDWHPQRLIDALAALPRPSRVQKREPFDFPERG